MTAVLAADQPPPVREFIEKWFEQDVFDPFIELVEKPVKRLRLLLPGAPELFRLFSGDEMFRDDADNFLPLDVDNFGAFAPPPADRRALVSFGHEIGALTQS